MITSALKRRELATLPGMKECVACGGSAVSSRGRECRGCAGTGAQRDAASVPRDADNVQHSSKSNEHYTPTAIVEAARDVLGGIDLDPASCALGNEVVKAAAWYGPDGLGPDGLVEPWCGRVFLNPPGGRVPDAYKGCGTTSNAALWWATLAEAWRTGEVEAAIFVGFTLEILRSAQVLDVPQPIDFPLCVPSSRIAFDTKSKDVCQDFDAPAYLKHTRVASKQPTHANVIVYLPPIAPDLRDVARHLYDPDKWPDFANAFGKIGRCRV